MIPVRIVEVLPSLRPDGSLNVHSLLRGVGVALSVFLVLSDGQ